MNLWNYKIFILLIVFPLEVIFETEGNEICYQLNHISSEFRVSSGGYDIDNLTQDLCLKQCTEYKFLFIGLVSGKYCFCGNSTEDLFERKLSLCNVSCSGNPDEICGSEDLDIIYVLEIDYDGSLENVEIIIEDKIFGTSDIVEFKIVVEASCQWVANVFFGDGTKFYYSGNETTSFTVQRHYIIPGEYVIDAVVQDKIGINVIASNEVVLRIEETDTKYSLACPFVVRPNIQNECSFVLWQGSSVSLKFEMLDFLSYFDIPDPYYTCVGNLVFDEIETSVEMNLSEEIILLPYSTVKIRSRLDGFEFRVAQPGTFIFYILKPSCEKGEYCIDEAKCSSTCSSHNVRQCTDKEALCSLNGQCMSLDPLLNCFTADYDYEIRYSQVIDSSLTGYKFVSSGFISQLDLFPGDVLGFKAKGNSSLYSRKSTEEEIKNGFQDVLLSDNAGLGIVHSARMLKIEPVNVSLQFTYNMTGNYSLSISVLDAWQTITEDKTVSVQIPVSNITLELNTINVMIKEGLEFRIFGTGSDFNLLWKYSDEIKEEYFEGLIPEEGIYKNLSCKSPGNYLLTVILSNEWSSENVSNEYNCYYPIGKTWSFNSNSPKSFPPGKVIFDLEFNGENLPTSAIYKIDFGDGTDDTQKIESESDEWKISFAHVYHNEGNFTAFVNISNPIDFEVFNLTITIFEKIGNLTVVPYYVKNGTYPEDRLDLKGLNKYDAPVKSTLYFENYISGHVTKFDMKFKDGSFKESYDKSRISYYFSEVGEWNISFIAEDHDTNEFSNDVEIFIRILPEVSDYAFNASLIEGEVDEVIEFVIMFDKLDVYSCIIFNGGDNSRLLAFGNKEECTQSYKEEDFKFIEKSTDSSRKSREVREAKWKDNSTISVLYSYLFGGEFRPSVDLFNSISSLKKSITIFIFDQDYDTPLLWIDKNSTDIEKPIECERGRDCRCETTAIFRNNASYLASHYWSAFIIDDDGKEDEIDLTTLKTHSCSAIRILKRFLSIGLYKLKYTVTVYAEEEKDIVNGEDIIYSIQAEQSNADDDYKSLLENRTILARRSVYTYLRIIPTPLIPMLIEGGASYVVRGFGQTILLQPTIYTEDPDFPDEIHYDITWFCLRLENDESLVSVGKHDYDASNPSKPISDRSAINVKDDKGGCFGKGPGLIEVESSDYEFNTSSFWFWNDTYEITAVIKKDGKVTESHLFMKIIPERPPSLQVMCEKKVACFPDVRGMYINPSAWVSLKVYCIQDCDYEDLYFEWHIFSSDLKLSNKIEIENWQKHSIVDFDRIGMNQTLYAEYPELDVFLVEAVGIVPNTTIPWGVSSIKLLINHPPENGNCRINSTSGMALLDMFSIEFFDWIDRDNHEIRDYSIYVQFGDELLRISYGMKSKTNVVLPYGDLEIWCAVEDYLGAVTMYSVANFSTNLPSEKEVEEFEGKRYYDKSLAEGKMSLVSQIVIAKNSIIREHKKRNNKQDKFSAVSESAIYALWEEYTNLEGIDSSYYTPQAKDEIREMLQENLENQMNRNAMIKNKELSRVLRLPMEALPDAEIYGGAISAVAEDGPTDKIGKLKIMKGIENMYYVINSTDVPHPENKRVVFNQFGNLVDTVAGSLADSNIGGNFIPNEIKQAEEELEYNATEPNSFIYYVEGNRKEVRDRLQNRAVEEAKVNQISDAKEMVTKIKGMVSEIQENCMEDLMINSDPFYTSSKKGFQMTFLKNFASSLSNEVVHQGKSSIVLPDLCKILNKVDCDKSDDVIGIQSVRWTQPLESYGLNSDNLSDNSNVVQIDITPREGNSTIPVNNSSAPFIICIPVSIKSNSDSKVEYVVPTFTSNDDILVYHTIFIDSPGVGVTVSIKPDDRTVPLIVIYKYGDYPFLHDYDGIERISSLQVNNGFHSLFIGSDIITDGGKNLTIGIGQVSNTTDINAIFESHKSYNLSVTNMTNEFTTNYFIQISTSGCYYFSDTEEKWSTEGCKVIENAPGVTCCACNHLTSFGSGFFVTPNEIDFNYVFSHAGFTDNITIYATIIVIFSLFILCLIFARWKDRKDLEKLGATPLPDNETGDKNIYEILVYTGHQRNAGTKSNVFFLVSGDDDETEVRHLADEKRPILQRGSIDVFVMTVPRSLGQLNYLRIWHDNSGSGKWSSWYCQYIVFRDVHSGLKYEFIINRWFGVEYDDGLIDRLIPVAGKEQVTEFSHVFSAASQRNFSDNHLWFSIFLRPPRSRFTRVQRVCCCMAVLCLSMLSNAMYYQRTSAKPSSGGFKFGPLSLSPEQIAVGIMSNILIFPPTFIMIFFFRRSRPRNLRPSRIEEAIKQQRSNWKKKNSTGLNVNSKNFNNKNDTEAQLYHRKKKFSFPWWCVYFGWLMVIIAIGSSLFFMWAYGIEFGDEKTSKWLTSLVVAFFSSLLITQPLKIILMTIVLACMCRSVDYDVDDADEDEEAPDLKNDEEYLHKDQQRKQIIYQPMDTDALEEARKEREKEVKMYSVIREISVYFLFLWIITILSYGNRDPNNFYLREALINGFIKPGDPWVDFNNVDTEKLFWNWTYNALVPELFAAQWYNGRSPLGLRLYLDDRNNLKIGYAVLRQVRIHPRNCKVSWLMESITPECAGFGGMIHEDGTLYTKGWIEVNSTQTLVPPEYKYLTASQLKGYPFWGQIDWYGGGGYVVPLVVKRDSEIESLILRLRRMEKEGWVDKHTRAVFVEFGVYNAQINLFCALTIVAEFLPGGGIVPYYHVDPLRLLNYHTGFGLIQLIVEILFVLFTIYFTVKEVSSMIREGWSYFHQYWNIAEVVSIVVSYTGIANHIYKLFATAEILRIFTQTEGTGYVKLQEAVLLNELFCYQIGIVMSISTLKFLKLLRFNKRIGVLSSTLRMCTQELQGYSVCLMVVFMAFVILFWLLLGRFVREFSSFIYSFESSISMMLKKFNYEDMYAAQPVLTPIAFFTFSLATSLVLVNILLSIIIRSFDDVKHDVSMQSNEYEVLDFFINRVKMMTGIGTAKVRPLPSMYRDKKKPQDSVSTFPAKVDRLVDFINDFYFDNQMDFNSKEFLKKMNTTLEQGKANARPVLKSKIPKNVSGPFDDF